VCLILQLICHSILFGVLYWYVWTVFIPRRNGCTLEETVDTLDDGTTVTRLVQVPKGSKLVPTEDLADDE
jgi:hypothetical protein